MCPNEYETGVTSKCPVCGHEHEIRPATVESNWVLPATW